MKYPVNFDPIEVPAIKASSNSFWIRNVQLKIWSFDFDVTFHPLMVNTIISRNGGGKTTLLDFIILICGCSSCDFLMERYAGSPIKIQITFSLNTGDATFSYKGDVDYNFFESIYKFRDKHFVDFCNYYRDDGMMGSIVDPAKTNRSILMIDDIIDGKPNNMVIGKDGLLTPPYPQGRGYVCTREIIKTLPKNGIPLIIDNIGFSFHPVTGARMKNYMRTMSLDHQIILSTHNPDMLNLKGAIDLRNKT